MFRIMLAGIAATALLAAAAYAQAPVAPAAAPAPAPATAPAPAPAPAAPGKSLWDYNPYSGEGDDLKKANRTQDEILSWAEQRVTEVLSFTPETVDAKLGTMKKNFVQQGWAEYAAYLKESDLLDRVRGQGYTVSTILNGDPLILNSGTVGGTYHWLLELPMMVTLLRNDSEGVPQPMSGGTFRLQLQVGRVASQGVDGMAIESWKVHTKTAP